MTIDSSPGRGWTIDTYKEYSEALRNAERRFREERDRRYAEVALEREKALKIKETADLAALQLAREIQTYKDEKANELREQISSERGLYATKQDLSAAVEKVEAMIRPLEQYVSRDLGRGSGFAASWAIVVAVISMALGIGSLIFTVSRGG